MSTENAAKGTPKSKGTLKEKEPRERLSQSSSVSAERLKTVVRRLPPNLPEDVFWQSVQTWVKEDTVSWKLYYPGKFRKRLNKENIPSRAYIAFKDEELLASFSRAYDGHVFRDKSGNESQAVVEFAPYQKIPTEKKKADARNATIEKDEDYISFLQSLDAGSATTEPVSLEMLVAAAQPPLPKTTPLLEALKAEKTAQKEKEIMARNQAQQKEAPSGPSITKKEDGKKKGVSVPKQPELAQLSKKAAKRAAAAAREAAAQPNAAVAGPANQPTAVKSSPPKPPRAPRQHPVIPVQANPSVLVANAPGGIAAPGTSPPTGPAVPSRRGRPVVSIASRQFEAALGGTGVAVASGSGGERKSRREREREREKGKEAVAGSPPTDKDVGRSGGGGGRRKEGKAAATVTIPTILQRTDGTPGPIINILQREGATQAPQIVGPSDEGDMRSVPGVITDGVPTRGTGRRWKGRGRGGGRTS